MARIPGCGPSFGARKGVCTGKTRTTWLEFLDVVLVSALRRAPAPGKLGPQVPKSRVAVLVIEPGKDAAPGKLGPPVPKSRVAVLVLEPGRDTAP